MSLLGDAAEGCSSGYQGAQSLSPLISPSSPTETCVGRSGGSPSPCTSPKRLDDSLILLHLPFNQHSKLEVKPGVLTRDAIAKILEKRAILPQMCRVCVGADPSSPRVDLSMDLETLSSVLEKKELWVHSAYLSILVSIKHSFVRKTFLSVAFCDVCHKQIWLQGYRCELCQFTFHQKCGSKVPNYCDRMQQISHDVHMANRLRDICDQYEGPNAALVAEIIQHFHSPAAETLSNHAGISRQQAVRLPGRVEIGGGINETARDRSSSAPNIYEISKNETLRESKVLDALNSSVQVHVQPSGVSKAAKPAHRDWHTAGFRRTNRLHPSNLSGMVSPSFTNSPSSTSSSPTPAYSGATYDAGSGMPPTPPQSAPPQKTYGFRFRSKSPNDKMPIRGPGGGPSSVSSDRLGDTHEGDNREKLKQRILMEGWEIDRSLVTYHKKIGSGSFGTVYLGSYFGMSLCLSTFYCRV
ncbi:unnamed protein product [Gongylonema pulchrum]|uniref:Phorbol-ester/DAG-type domain-containing protein n=1 Tax=Gongylonema pulchrum TaxID=637853 RepID=A0A183DR26_9BILA|nr:unnamed protein product [Gongylonema pulchrum]